MKRKNQLTTSRVDLETVHRIKTLEHELLMETGIRLKQWEIIKYAILYVLEKKEDFIKYSKATKDEETRGAFDTLVNATGKPWFPYGNIVKTEK